MNTQHISNASLSPSERICQLLRVELVQEGADPSRLLSSLALAIETEAWKSLGIADFRAFIESDQGLSASVDDIKTLVSLRHRHEGIDSATRERMDWLRAQVWDLLNPEGRRPGRPKKTDNADNVRNKAFGNDPDYALRRLKRDNPELASRVLRGEISAHAAAVEAGFRPKTITVPLNPEKMARAIRRRLDDDEIDTLINALGEVD